MKTSEFITIPILWLFFSCISILTFTLTAYMCELQFMAIKH